MTDPPENQKFDRKSGHRNSPELPPSDSDFWDLDEESEPAAKPTKPEPRQESSVELRKRSGGPTNQKTGKDAPEEAARPRTKVEETKEEIEPQTLGEATSNLIGKFSKSERLAILGVGAGLLVTAIWGLSLFFSSIQTESPDTEVDFPVAGNIATIKNAATFWQEPNTEKHRGVRKDTQLIPSAKITLDDASQSGALRILFEDDAERIVGDPVTLAFNGGQFSNNSDTVEVYATEGFNDVGNHAAYMTDQIGKWYLVIKEGPDVNSPGKDFVDVLRMPISNTRH